MPFLVSVMSLAIANDSQCPKTRHHLIYIKRIV